MKPLHFLVTLQWSTGRGIATISRDGVVAVEPGTTRQAAVVDILRTVRQQAGAPDTATILFFSLEPNTL